MSHAISFLDLPPEVRLIIYRYLMPNIPIKCYYHEKKYYNPRPNKPKGMREDGCQQCAPALLRTNRQIYEELMPEWYGSVPYSIYLLPNEIFREIECFTGPVMPHAPLPSVWRMVRTLDLSIIIHVGQQLPSPTGYSDPIAAVMDFLVKPGGRLRRLNLCLVIEEYYWRYFEDEEAVRQITERNIRPIRERLHGIADMEARCDFAERRPGIFATWDRGIIALQMMQEALDNLRDEVLARNKTVDTA